MKSAEKSGIFICPCIIFVEIVALRTADNKSAIKDTVFTVATGLSVRFDIIAPINETAGKTVAHTIVHFIKSAYSDFDIFLLKSIKKPPNKFT